MIFRTFFIKWDTPEHREFTEVEGILRIAEGLFLNYLASQLQENSTVVEIGSYKGRSAVALCSGLKNGGNFYAIDTFQSDNMIGYLKQDVYAEFQTNTSKYKNIITAIKKESDEAVKTWDRQIDLLFIDANHSYDTVNSDILNWFPFLKINGILAFHDYIPFNGVERAINELVIDKLDNKTLVCDLLAGAKKEELCQK